MALGHFLRELELKVIFVVCIYTKFYVFCVNCSLTPRVCQLPTKKELYVNVKEVFVKRISKATAKTLCCLIVDEAKGVHTA